MTTRVTLPMTSYAWDPESPLGELLTAYGVALEYQLGLHGSFLGLTDVDVETYTGIAGYHIVVNATGTGLTAIAPCSDCSGGGSGGGGGSSVTKFTDLLDTPDSLSKDPITGLPADNAGKLIVINAESDGLTFAEPFHNTFTGLNQTPSTFVGSGGKYLRVNAGETALEFVVAPSGGGSSTFLGLTDTPSAYSGQGGKAVAVKADISGLEFVTIPRLLTQLSDVNIPTLAGQSGKHLVVNGSNQVILEAPVSPAIPSFLSLTDTPSSYSGQDGKMVVVSGAGLAFATVPSGGGGGSANAPIIVAVSPETTTLTTGAAKVTFRAPKAFTLANVRASLTTASELGVVTVDVNLNGSSIFTTPLTIDVAEKTSVTAATPMTLGTTAIPDDAEFTIDVDTAGQGAIGLKVTLIPA